ncbi:MAG: hypothetical protein JNM31_01750 [Flavobacteriales bacterium]|nr:hypothetical protein [Flavobacteriales bacterium]
MLCVLTACVARGQDEEWKPALGYRVLFTFDFRRTLIAGEPSRINGVRLGAQKGKDIMAIGFYGLADPYLSDSLYLTDVPYPTNIRVGITYFGITYERVLHDSRRWHFSLPFTVGIGDVVVDRTDSAGIYLPYSRSEAFTTEGGAKAAYKIFFWLHAQAGIGYRGVFTDDPEARRTFSGPVWNYGLSLKFGEIVRHYNRRHRKKKQHGEGPGG